MRLIDADELKMSIKMLAKDIARANGGVDDITLALKEAYDMVCDALAVDAAPVVHARNVTPTHPSDEFVCGNCGFCCEITEIRHDDEDDFGLGEASAHEYECKFCPECGAKMDGGANNE